MNIFIDRKHREILIGLEPFFIDIYDFEKIVHSILTRVQYVSYLHLDQKSFVINDEAVVRFKRMIAE